MIIRSAEPEDKDLIRQIYLLAFDLNERELVSDLAIKLLDMNSNPGHLNLVSEINDELVGHISFSPVYDLNEEKALGAILAPLAVLPEHQNCGVGTGLVESGLQILRDRNIDIVFVYGDPAYYSKFGFGKEITENFRPPFPLQYPHGWQALAMRQRSESGALVKKQLKCVSALCKKELW